MWIHPFWSTLAKSKIANNIIFAFQWSTNILSAYHNQNTVRKHYGNFIWRCENHRRAQHCWDAYDRIICESIQKITAKNQTNQFDVKNNYEKKMAHNRMHINQRPIVPVKNAANVADKNVANNSLHADPSILSRLVANEIFNINWMSLKFFRLFEIDLILLPEIMAERILLSSAPASETKSMQPAYNCWCADERSPCN